MPTSPELIEVVAASLFAVAVIHTFLAKQLDRLARRYPAHTGLLHLLGEVEVVFGFWAIVLVVAMAFISGGREALAYAGSRQYTEPLFVFVVMVIAASRPVLQAVVSVIALVARRAPFSAPLATAWLGLAVVPLLGSVVTEPAAMTIAALLLSRTVFVASVPEGPKYFALGVLFVNVSIGGTLTSYAAPPVLMVASAWNWDSAFMLANFGWRAAAAVLINATLAAFALRRSLASTGQPPVAWKEVPVRIVLVHFAFLAGVVALAHNAVALLALFLVFAGFAHAYRQHQDPLILRQAFLVALFLAGLVVLGGMQAWWLQPLVGNLDASALFAGALALTAITDNAAITYLGSRIEGLDEVARYLLVAGAVAGGGLTVIANAPNPAGAALLKGGFADGAVGAGGLFLGALIPTLVAAVAFGLT